MKEISVMAGKANIPDKDISSILLFIEKQPTEIRVGLNHLAVTKGAYTSLRTLFRDATSLSTSYDKFLLPLLILERFLVVVPMKTRKLPCPRSCQLPESESLTMAPVDSVPS
jgi:hypothetical protein